MNREPDPKEALICFVIFIIILLMMFFYMIFIERNTVRDDDIPRNHTSLRGYDGANGAPELVA